MHATLILRFGVFNATQCPICRSEFGMWTNRQITLVHFNETRLRQRRLPTLPPRTERVLESLRDPTRARHQRRGREGIPGAEDLVGSLPSARYRDRDETSNRRRAGDAVLGGPHRNVALHSQSNHLTITRINPRNCGVKLNITYMKINHYRRVTSHYYGYWRTHLYYTSPQERLAQNDRRSAETPAIQEEPNMSTREDPPAGVQSSRRNLIRMGAIVASAIIAKTTTAAADGFRREDNDWDDRRERDRWGRDYGDRDGRESHCFLRGTLIRTVTDKKRSKT